MANQECIVILSEAKNHGGQDSARNPSGVSPVVILRFAQNDNSNHCSLPHPSFWALSQIDESKRS